MMSLQNDICYLGAFSPTQELIHFQGQKRKYSSVIQSFNRRDFIIIFCGKNVNHPTLLKNKHTCNSIHPFSPAPSQYSPFMMFVHQNSLDKVCKWTKVKDRCVYRSKWKLRNDTEMKNSNGTAHSYWG